MEDFLEELMARVREQGVTPRVDPRMAAADTDTTYVTFVGPAEEDADCPGPNAPGSSRRTRH
jgi:hypothetical protein